MRRKRFPSVECQNSMIDSCLSSEPARKRLRNCSGEPPAAGWQERRRRMKTRRRCSSDASLSNLARASHRGFFHALLLFRPNKPCSSLHALCTGDSGWRCTTKWKFVHPAASRWDNARERHSEAAPRQTTFSQRISGSTTYRNQSDVVGSCMTLWKRRV